jgi:hypothetical protein
MVKSNLKAVAPPPKRTEKMTLLGEEEVIQ